MFILIHNPMLINRNTIIFFLISICHNLIGQISLFKTIPTPEPVN
jgi:hypothetical protein